MKDDTRREFDEAADRPPLTPEQKREALERTVLTRLEECQLFASLPVPPQSLSVEVTTYTEAQIQAERAITAAREHWPAISEETQIERLPSRIDRSHTMIATGFMDDAGIKAALWRFLGRLFRRRHWVQRGRIPKFRKAEATPTTKPIAEETETIKIVDFQSPLFPPCQMGYSEKADTLFIQWRDAR